jgi:hypothetical protein
MTPYQLLNNSYEEFVASLFWVHVAQKSDALLADEVRVVCRQDGMRTIRICKRGN